MPSLYGSTITYTVSATSVSTLYLGSTTTFTATTYSTNLAGLYGGSYAALPNNAQQLFQLFDNNGNVQFYLDPVTNSSTIAAYVNLSTGTISIGNYAFNGNTVTNLVNGPIVLNTNGESWTFNTDGSTSFPNYTFPSAHGSAGQILTDNGSGALYWNSPAPGGVTDIHAGTGIAISTSTGSVTISNTGVRSITAGTSTYVSTSTGDIVIWTLPPPTVSTAYDFGTILAPVSYTLDMGPIIV